MRIREFPACCSARVISDFGGTVFSTEERRFTAETIRDFIDDFVSRNGRYLVTATTNRAQENANRALREYGFEHTPWMRAGDHGSEIRLWWLRPSR